MTMIDQRRVTAAFDRAEHYAGHAGVQRQVAEGLAARIAALGLPEEARVLEIGCGTGFLTGALLGGGIGGEWLITDKAPGMVERCRSAAGEAPGRAFAVLDGEYGLGALEGRFGLICASMTMQWFDNLPGAVTRLVDLLEPGGHLVFNTLAGGTFGEWRAAHEACGLAAGAVAFPPADEVVATLRHFAPALLTVERHVEHHADARQFLDRLKLVGAATPRPGHVPLSPGDLKRVMAAFDAAGAEATYEVVTCHIAG